MITFSKPITRKIVALGIVALLGLLTIVYIHDNPAGIVAIASINSDEVPIGTDVIVKGEVTWVLIYFMGPYDQVSFGLCDGSGNLSIGTRIPVYDGWTVIVWGSVRSNDTMSNVTDIERVWLFP